MPKCDARVFASPLARRIALQKGLDLSNVKGSGPGGRIIRQDVDHGIATIMRSQTVALSRDEPPLPIQTHKATIKDAGSRSLRHFNEATYFNLTVDIEVDALLDLRSEINARFTKSKSYSNTLEISVDDMIVKAAAIALRRIPQLNLHFIEGNAEVSDHIDISVAVFLPKGSVKPVIRRADEKGLAELSGEIKSLTEQAMAGTLKPEPGKTSCFSISSMNTRGIKTYQASILAAGSTALAISSFEPRPVIKNGQLAVANMMSVTLSADSNVIDESIAAEWIDSFKAILQEPLSMML